MTEHQWIVYLGGRPAIYWPHGDTAIQALVLFVEENYPQLFYKRMIGGYDDRFAELNFGAVHIRVEAR